MANVMQSGTAHISGTLQSGLANFGTIGNIINNHVGNVGGTEVDIYVTRRTACMRGLFVCDMIDVRRVITTTAKTEPNPKVCQWVLEAQEYLQWSDVSTGPRLLWISGESGTGKTMLALYISRILENSHRGSRDFLVLDHFCDFTDQEHKQPVSIVRSIMWNMIEQWDHLYKDLETDYQKQEDALFKGRSSSIEALWRIWLKMLKRLQGKTIYIIVDGLDVMSSQEADLLYLLRKITMFYDPAPATYDSSPMPSSTQDAAASRAATTSATQSSSLTAMPYSATPRSRSTPHSARREKTCTVKLLLLSRRSPPNCLESELATVSCLDLNANKNQGYAKSLKTFFDLRYQSLPQAANLNRQDSAMVSQAFEERKDTSFVAVKYVLQQLQSSDASQATDVIQSSPTGLTDMYLHALEALPQDVVYTCAAVLRWVAVAWRPMTVPEMSQALTIAAGPMYQQQFSVHSIMRAISVCSSMLILSEGTIVFTHQSAWDFVLSSDWHRGEQNEKTRHLSMFWVDAPVAHAEIARACLKCFTYPDILKRSINVVKPGFAEARQLQIWPFLAYAILYWPCHARTASLTVNDYNLPFFAKVSKLREAWWQSFEISMAPRVSWKWLVAEKFTLLHIACRFDLIGLAEHVERNGWLSGWLNAHDSHKVLPIEYAAIHDCRLLMAFMLRKGAWVSDQRYEDLSVLHNATRTGNLEMMQVILANRQISIDIGGSEMAFNKAYTWFVIMRTIPGVTNDVLNGQEDANGMFGRMEMKSFGENIRPLHLAVNYGHEKVARFLLEHGANPVAPTTWGFTPVHFAALHGQTDMLQLLIEERGAMHTLEAVTNEYWTPLHCAARWGVWESVQYLVDRGARVDAVTMKRKTPLHIAIYRNNVYAATVLLNEGADPEAIDHKGRTPLLTAQERGHVQSVQLLIDMGANPSFLDPKGVSIYMRALNKNQSQIVAIMARGPRPIEEINAEMTGQTAATDQQPEVDANFPWNDGDDYANSHNEALPAYSVLIGPDTKSPLDEKNCGNTEHVQPRSQEFTQTQTETKTVQSISRYFHSELQPSCLDFVRNMPTDPGVKRRKYLELTDTIETKVMHSLDSLNLDQDADERAWRKTLIDCCNDLLLLLDESFRSGSVSSQLGATTGEESQQTARETPATDEQNMMRPQYTAYRSAPETTARSASVPLAESVVSASGLRHMSVTSSGHDVQPQIPRSLSDAFERFNIQSANAATYEANANISSTSTAITQIQSNLEHASRATTSRPSISISPAEERPTIVKAQTAPALPPRRQRSTSELQQTQSMVNLPGPPTASYNTPMQSPTPSMASVYHDTQSHQPAAQPYQWMGSTPSQSRAPTPRLSTGFDPSVPTPYYNTSTPSLTSDHTTPSPTPYMTPQQTGYISPSYLSPQQTGYPTQSYLSPQQTQPQPQYQYQYPNQSYQMAPPPDGRASPITPPTTTMMPPNPANVSYLQPAPQYSNHNPAAPYGVSGAPSYGYDPAAHGVYSPTSFAPPPQMQSPQLQKKNSMLSMFRRS